jgi:hypothetical protein
MVTPQRDYSALREAHARAVDELTRHIEQQKAPAVEAGQGQDRASGVERAAVPETERQSDLPAEPHRPNYAALREEHTRAVDALNVAEPEPTRPTEIRSPGWTSRGGLVEHETSARAWVKYRHQQRLREGLDQRIEDTRADRSVESPDATPKNTDRDRDDGVER